MTHVALLGDHIGGDWIGAVFALWTKNGRQGLKSRGKLVRNIPYMKVVIYKMQAAGADIVGGGKEKVSFFTE